jgi:arylsulfatase A-like enzyme
MLTPPNPFWLEHEEVTLAEALKTAGYTSCHIGKWHLGDDAWFPQHQGFDFNYGGCDYGQPPSYFDPYTNKSLPQGIPHLPPRKEGEYLSDREADEAVQFILENKDKPFFLYLAHYAVHTPIQAKESAIEKYDALPKTNHKNAKYAGMVESVDDSTGRVLAALKEAGVDDKTVIIFTSDNGGLKGPTDNTPLRSGKGYPYEGGIRVPLIVRWPGEVKPGTISNAHVTSVDYFPTLLELAGVDLPKDRAIDGVSLVNHIKTGGETALEREAIYWHFPHYRHGDSPYSIIRQGDWKLIKFYADKRFELFNLKDDLGEERDLASAIPDKVKALNKQLMEHLESMGAKLPRSNPDYVPAEADQD